MEQARIRPVVRITAEEQHSTKGIQHTANITHYYIAIKIISHLALVLKPDDQIFLSGGRVPLVPLRKDYRKASADIHDRESSPGVAEAEQARKRPVARMTAVINNIRILF